VTVGLLLKGIAIGFSIAAPVGPIGVLCIRRTLAEGRLAGLVSGLGAATADLVYGLVAGLGLTLISDILVERQQWLRLVGGAFLCYLGTTTFLAHPNQRAAPQRAEGVFGLYASTFFLTLTNPLTILSFAAIFAGLGLTETGAKAAWELVLGVFIGSALWWLTLSTIVGVLRHRLSQTALGWVNRLAGTVIAGFGLASLVALVV
jgi:threonine/homoserine/homoserine lactone efflux protein